MHWKQNFVFKTLSTTFISRWQRPLFPCNSLGLAGEQQTSANRHNCLWFELPSTISDSFITAYVPQIVCWHTVEPAMRCAWFNSDIGWYFQRPQKFRWEEKLQKWENSDIIPRCSACYTDGANWNMSLNEASHRYCIAPWRTTDNQPYSLVRGLDWKQPRWMKTWSKQMLKN